MTGDEGGQADVTNLEQDMRDVIKDWQDGAKDGVGQFVTNNLSSRLDDIESGNWATFILGLMGNTIWAAAAFTPVGAPAFALSMFGIAVAATPTVPKKSKSGIPEAQKVAVDYINGIHKQLDGQLRGKAATLLREHPDATRYRALAAFVRNSFAPNMVTIDPTYQTVPMVDQTAIRDRFVEVATERLEIATKVGQSTTRGGAGGGKYATPTRTDVTEVAWIEGSIGRPRLAILETSWDREDTAGYVPGDASHTFKNWVSPDGIQAAIAQWINTRRVAPATYEAEEINDLTG